MEVPLAIIGTVAALLSAVLVASGLARSRRNSAGTPSKTEAGSATSGLSLSSVVGVVSVLLLLIANIFKTADVVSGNKEPAILFLLWILFAGGAIFSRRESLLLGDKQGQVAKILDAPVSRLASF